MSVLADLSIFPMDQGESLSAFVAPVVAMLRGSGVEHQLTAMGTLIETETLAEALQLVERAESLMREQGSRRVYATLKLDIREGPVGRLNGKIESVEKRLS